MEKLRIGKGQVALMGFVVVCDYLEVIDFVVLGRILEICIKCAMWSGCG